MQMPPGESVSSQLSLYWRKAPSMERVNVIEVLSCSLLFPDDDSIPVLRFPCDDWKWVKT